MERFKQWKCIAKQRLRPQGLGGAVACISRVMPSETFLKMYNKFNEICPVLKFLMMAQDAQQNKTPQFADLEDFIDQLYSQPLPTEPEPKFVDQFDVMTTYHLSRTTLYIWRKEGLPSYSIGGKVFFRMDEVKRFIENHKKGGDHVSDC